MLMNASVQQREFEAGLSHIRAKLVSIAHLLGP